MKKSKGSTLLELAVVLAILAILASFAVPNIVTLTYNAQQLNAKQRLLQGWKTFGALEVCTVLTPTQCSGLLGILPPVGVQNAGSYSFYWNTLSPTVWTYTASPLHPRILYMQIDNTGLLQCGVTLAALAPCQ